ncbi:unnamed protein product [Urochloa humidicola]
MTKDTGSTCQLQSQERKACHFLHKLLQYSLNYCLGAEPFQLTRRLPKDLGIVQIVKMQLWCPQPSGTFPGSEEEKELSQQSAPNALEERKEKVSFANVGLH